MLFRRIRDLREDKDLNQSAIAGYLGIDQSTYSGYELGKVNVPIEALMKLADFHSVSLDYLTGRTNVKQAYPRE